MGGRGASAGWDGGGNGPSPTKVDDLISQRERKRAEVDQTLTVLRDVRDQYGLTVDTEIGTFRPGATVMGYYDQASGNVGLSKAYFDAIKIDGSYDDCVRTRFHPPRGNKTGTEAVISHEMGHALTGKIAQKMGVSFEKASRTIVQEAKRSDGYRGRASDWAARISRYALKNESEAIAEAFADVYCNGNRAKRESRAIVDVLNKYVGGTR